MSQNINLTVHPVEESEAMICFTTLAAVYDTIQDFQSCELENLKAVIVGAEESNDGYQLKINVKAEHDYLSDCFIRSYFMVSLEDSNAYVVRQVTEKLFEFKKCYEARVETCQKYYDENAAIKESSGSSSLNRYGWPEIKKTDGINYHSILKQAKQKAVTNAMERVSNIIKKEDKLEKAVDIVNNVKFVDDGKEPNSITVTTRLIAEFKKQTGKELKDAFKARRIINEGFQQFKEIDECDFIMLLLSSHNTKLKLARFIEEQL